ncbi:MAG: sulfurtransferase [Calditrichia bacterium]
MLETLISTENLHTHLGQENWIIIDCRYGPGRDGGREGYLKGHIPGARYAHLDDDLAAPHQPDVTGRHPLPDVKTFGERLGSWGISNDTQVIVYDQGIGGFAARLWWMLRWVGHDAVAVLDGGWNSWKFGGYEESTTVPVPTHAYFEVHPRPEMLTSLEQLETNLENPGMQLVDSRSHERYIGKNEPFDPIAGHIPGAVSLPFTDNAVNGRFRTSAELRKRFSESLNSESDETVFYCGSGVTACHNILAWKHAGLGDASLYVGSWSEWIVGRGRPMNLSENEDSDNI